MPGPLPKPLATRRRQNRVANARVFTAGPRPVRVPKLPKHDIAWSEHTKAWWLAVWRAPMADAFLEVDVHALIRLAVLVNEFSYRPKTQLAGEIRLQEQRFGLTPIDRVRLQWQVHEERPRDSAQPTSIGRAAVEDYRKRIFGRKA